MDCISPGRLPTYRLPKLLQRPVLTLARSSPPTRGETGIACYSADLAKKR
jgi:hypothetical protein